MMRPLVMDFREDKNVYSIDDQFMFGPFIMVSPITLPEVNEREVYLPNGNWYDFWTGRTTEGGKWIMANAPIDIIPLHVREGSIIPLAPEKSSADEEFNEIELRVYSGKDSKFLLYDDDGVTYDYERGKYLIIPLEWNETKQELLIGRRVGDYWKEKQMIFRIVWVRENNGVGVDIHKGDEIVEYKGDEIRVKRK